MGVEARVGEVPDLQVGAGDRDFSADKRVNHRRDVVDSDLGRVLLRITLSIPH
jgi:hypothetical protein